MQDSKQRFSVGEQLTLRLRFPEGRMVDGVVKRIGLPLNPIEVNLQDPQTETDEVDFSIFLGQLALLEGKAQISPHPSDQEGCESTFGS